MAALRAQLRDAAAPRRPALAILETTRYTAHSWPQNCATKNSQLACTDILGHSRNVEHGTDGPSGTPREAVGNSTRSRIGARR